MNQPFQIFGHEEVYGTNGEMAPLQNPGGVLEVMEKGTRKVQDAEDAPSAGVEST